MEILVTNRVRRHLLSLAIFTHGESCAINRIIKRHLLSLAIYFPMESRCNKSYYKTSIAVGYIFPWKVV